MKTYLTSALTSALIAALGLVTTVSAADTVTVKLLDNGFNQQLEIPLDEIAVGTSRQLATASGLPAIVTRRDNGLTIEVAGRTTEIDLPDHTRLDLDGAHGKRHVEIVKHHDGAHADGEHKEKRFVIKRIGEGGAAHDVDIDELLADGEAQGDGKRVVVVRRINKDEASSN